MPELNRRETLAGAAATLLAAMTPGQAHAALDAMGEWVQGRTTQLRWVVRYLWHPVFQGRFAEGDKVQIKLKSGRQDRRTYKAASLEAIEGRVRVVIPATAVPWRYVQHRWKGASARFVGKLRRCPEWRRRSAGPLYAVGTKKGWVIVSHQRMRALRSGEALIGR